MHHHSFCSSMCSDLEHFNTGTLCKLRVCAQEDRLLWTRREQMDLSTAQPFDASLEHTMTMFPSAMAGLGLNPNTQNNVRASRQ